MLTRRQLCQACLILCLCFIEWFGRISMSHSTFSIVLFFNANVSCLDWAYVYGSCNSLQPCCTKSETTFFSVIVFLKLSVVLLKCLSVLKLFFKVKLINSAHQIMIVESSIQHYECECFFLRYVYSLVGNWVVFNRHCNMKCHIRNQSILEFFKAQY